MAKRILYKASDGKRVPSVTTILSRFKDSGGLIYWANQQGLDGLTLEEARQQGATAGTLAHEMVEEWVNGRPLPELPENDKGRAARQAFNNFLNWHQQSRMEFVYTEVSLVSESHRFGGRLDAVAKGPDGELVMVDFKTGALYADHVYQIAAYRALWNENYPDSPVLDGAHLVSFKRENADFSHSYFGGLEFETQTFLAMRSLYDRVKQVEKRVK